MNRRIFLRNIAVIFLSVPSFGDSSSNQSTKKIPSTYHDPDFNFIKTYLEKAFPIKLLSYTLDGDYENKFNIHRENINSLTKQAFGISVKDLKNTKPSLGAKLFEQRRMKDFNQLSLAQVDGWVLSRSEQALYALFNCS